MSEYLDEISAKEQPMADEQQDPAPRPEGGATPLPPPPAEKPPAKKAVPGKKAAKKAPAKKAPAKKAPAKKAVPAKKVPAKKAFPLPPAPVVESANGAAPSPAKQAAAQAKSAVASSGPVLVPQPGPERSNLPIAVAIAAGVLAVLVVLLARRAGDDD